MISPHAPLATLAMLALLAAGAHAQPPAAAPGRAASDAAEAGDEDADIVVTGQRERGAVIGDIKPEVQLGPADIRSYGVSSVADLINELAPQTRSDRGRGGEAPVILLNGRRISGFGEIRDLPTEAIQRVDILPEEVALKYGYSANQRVVNIVLRRRFRALTGELAGGVATSGGGANGQGSLDLTRIQGNGRLTLDAKYQENAGLRESQRGIISTASGAPVSAAGNVAAPGGTGGEIDPALSALAGGIVTLAGVPAAAATRAPTLAEFAANANAPDTQDLARYRSLRPATRDLTLSSVYNHTVLGNVSATVNASLDAADNRAERGLPSATLLVPAGDPFSPFGRDVALYRTLGDDPLTQRTSNLMGHLGVSLNGDVAKWRWTFTGNYDHADARIATATGIDLTAQQALLAARDTAFNPFGTLTGDRRFDRATSRSDTGNVQLVASGPILDLPAGPLSTTLTVGGTIEDFGSRSLRSGIAGAVDLSRRTGTARINVDVPLTSRREGVLAAIGDVTANANAQIDRVSGFGTLHTLGYGLNWTPRDPIRFIASFTTEEGVPTVQQIGNPLVVTPDVRVYDAARGVSADVIQIDGGNAALRADNRHVMKLGLTLKPFAKTDLTITADYVRSRIRNAIATLPEPTAALEAAFPDRYLRDADGDLVRIDVRPVNFARENRSELRTGINFSRPLKPAASQRRVAEAYRERFAALRAAQAGSTRPPDGDGTRAAGGSSQAGATPPADGARPGGTSGSHGNGTGGSGSGSGSGSGGGGSGGPGGGFGGRGGGSGGRGGGGGRLQFAVYHTWLFRDDILIRDGVPVLDLLNGAAIGAAGGQPRHEIELQAGYSNNGLGARLSGDWQSGTRVTGASGSTTGDLRFSSLATTSLRLFANLGQLPSLARHRWAQGARVTLSVTNLFDQRLDVRDATGDTPLRFQPGYLDPLGRTVRISLRKLLF